MDTPVIVAMEDLVLRVSVKVALVNYKAVNFFNNRLKKDGQINAHPHTTNTPTGVGVLSIQSI